MFTFILLEPRVNELKNSLALLRRTLLSSESLKLLQLTNSVKHPERGRWRAITEPQGDLLSVVKVTP